MAWITTKDGKHINTDWFDKENQIARNKAEADKMNGKSLDTTTLEKIKYKGIWYGANKSPISTKELLDKIIANGGRSFYIKTKMIYSSDNLLDAGKKQYILSDESGRGKLKLNEDMIKYLIANLNDDSYIKKQLSQ